MKEKNIFYKFFLFIAIVAGFFFMLFILNFFPKKSTSVESNTNQQQVLSVESNTTEQQKSSTENPSFSFNSIESFEKTKENSSKQDKGASESKASNSNEALYASIGFCLTEEQQQPNRLKISEAVTKSEPTNLTNKREMSIRNRKPGNSKSSENLVITRKSGGGKSEKSPRKSIVLYSGLNTAGWIDNETMLMNDHLNNSSKILIVNTYTQSRKVILDLAEAKNLSPWKDKFIGMKRTSDSNDTFLYDLKSEKKSYIPEGNEAYFFLNPNEVMLQTWDNAYVHSSYNIVSGATRKISNANEKTMVNLYSKRYFAYENNNGKGYFDAPIPGSPFDNGLSYNESSSEGEPFPTKMLNSSGNVIKVFTNSFEILAFSPDGNYMAIGNAENIIIREISSNDNKIIKKIKIDRSSQLTSAYFSPNSKRLAYNTKSLKNIGSTDKISNIYDCHIININ